MSMYRSVMGWGAVVAVAIVLAPTAILAQERKADWLTGPQTGRRAARLLRPGGEPARPFSSANDCKFCHPRQFEEWRSSPHGYTGVSPTFYSLTGAGQNSPGAAVGATPENGNTALGGAVGSFCMPCHSPLAFAGLQGRYGGNNMGFANVEPVYPFVCSTGPNVFQPCTPTTAAGDCFPSDPGNPAAATSCQALEGRSCANMPPASANGTFPRVLVRCDDDSDCAGGNNGCPVGRDCGPCIITSSTVYYPPIQQEGITCEACHNVLPNHRRACQLFRNSDSVGVLSYDLAERSNADGFRLRLGPYPTTTTADNQGLPNDMLPPVTNAFHDSARVDTPLSVPYDQTYYAFGVFNPDNEIPFALRPTDVTCGELPYCSAGWCEGGSAVLAGGSQRCTRDFDCGGCAPTANGGNGECGPGSPRVGEACRTSTDCAFPDGASNTTLLARGIAQGTIGPLTELPGGGIDRPDGNFYRSSMMCAACHDVRPGQRNAILRSCQLQKGQVCSRDDDCRGLNVGCAGNDCGPCVMENNSAYTNPGNLNEVPFAGSETTGDPRNTGYRRVENLFSEWQLSVYNQFEKTFCQGNSFIACTSDADCGSDAPCNVRSPYGQAVTCQDCHMSNFPETPIPLASGGVPGNKNEVYPVNLVAVEGSQTDTSVPLPERRVSTHFMSGVDLPLLAFPGQATQRVRRQQLVDASFNISLEETPTTGEAGELFDVELTIENVGVGHRVPAGFSHERQFWVQMYVQDAAALGSMDPFDDDAPCNMQRNVAVGADDHRDEAGALELEQAGCVFRSGFILDKAHPETGETFADGSLEDEDPEDFFVVAGTRLRGIGTAANPDRATRIEVRPGADGRALTIQHICAEATEEAYDEAIRAGSGIDVGTDPSFPFQAVFCDPGLSPDLPGEGDGFTPPGFGNPDCRIDGEDKGPCVPEIELSDGNERGRCAGDISRPFCQSDEECGPSGPCLYRCPNFPELECCAPDDPNCREFYQTINMADDEGNPFVCELRSESGRCVDDPEQACGDDSECGPAGCGFEVCIRGERSGLVCKNDSDCPGSNNCGYVGGDVEEGESVCLVENRGIVNFQNQFRETFNGVCVNADNPRDPVTDEPIRVNDTLCLLNSQCGAGNVCLVNGQCAGGERAGEACTNVTYRQDCPGDEGEEPYACNVQFNLELNGAPSESVFIQNHPFNFNSLPPFQPRVFKYDFEIPESFAGRELVVAARIMNRHFPMRFLRNLIGSQVVRPPLIIEDQGNPNNPDDCRAQRTIDIDCFVRPLRILGNATAGGALPAVQRTVTTTVDVE